jgi:hypothetical protein
MSWKIYRKERKGKVFANLRGTFAHFAVKSLFGSAFGQRYLLGDILIEEKYFSPILEASVESKSFRQTYDIL